jgi:uncharacterized membrane protein YhiD involved in acid resistance
MFESISDTVEIALVTSVLALVGTLVTAWFSYLAQKRAKQASDHAEQAKTEVTNRHPKNIRDDLDDQFQQVKETINYRMDQGDKRMDGIESDIRGIRRDVGRASDERRDLANRIHDLEVGPPIPLGL